MDVIAYLYDMDAIACLYGMVDKLALGAWLISFPSWHECDSLPSWQDLRKSMVKWRSPTGKGHISFGKVSEIGSKARTDEIKM
ncbi:hypothetical protein Tco_1389321 [Tanacetum coccineum]